MSTSQKPVSTPEDALWAVRRTSFVYLTIFAWSGVNQPYMPSLFESRGLAPSEIAIIVGAPFFVRLLVTPLVGRLADAVGDSRRLVGAMAAGALLLAAILWHVNGFLPLLLLYVVMMMLLQNVPPVFDAAALNLVREGVARDFGRMRLFGSAGYALATVIGGFAFARGGIEAMFAGFVLAIVALLFASRLIPPAPAPRKPAPKVEISILRRPALLAMTIAAGLVLGSQATWNSFGVIELRRAGASEGLIGLIWSAGTAAEVLMFWAGPILARRMSPTGILALAAIGGILRWGIMALIPGVIPAFVAQTLHALTFGATHIGIMAILAAAVSSRRGGSAQADLVTVNSLVMGLASFAVGPIYARFHGQAYLASALMCLVALVLVAIFWRRVREETEPVDRGI